MLDEAREVTDDAIIGKALQALVDGPVAEELTNDEAEA